MKKFDAYERNEEIRYKNRNELREGCTCDCEEPQKVAEFTTLEDAQEWLNKQATEICEFDSAIGTIFSVKEFVIQENEYDEDNEVVDYGDIWISKMEIKVVDEDGELVKVCDNYEDAEHFTMHDDRELKIVY